jgi:hypothetical protein
LNFKSPKAFEHCAQQSTNPSPLSTHNSI